MFRRIALCLGFAAAAVFSATLPVHAQDQKPALPTGAVMEPDVNQAAKALVGKKAPDFSLPDQADKLHKLSSEKGHWVVIAFYPKDKTPGCTFQNRSYSQAAPKFAPLNARVFTISTQDTASKRDFCTLENLKHTLLADVGGKVAARYNVLSGTYARRVTFYIAPDGTVAEVDTQPRVATAGEDSLATLKRLAAPKDVHQPAR